MVKIENQVVICVIVRFCVIAKQETTKFEKTRTHQRPIEEATSEYSHRDFSMLNLFILCGLQRTFYEDGCLITNAL